MNEAWLAPLKDIAQQAGEAIMDFYRQGETQTWTKKDDSPITEADLAAHHIIVDALAQLTPNIPVLSEESDGITWEERSKWQQYWLVDPLDGTKEFIKQNGEFTVNIALIEDNQPTMAVVYAPALNSMYYASETQGCYLEQDNQAPQLLDLTNQKLSETTRVVGSRSHASPDMNKFTEQFTQVELVPTGSSLKFCLIAQGIADIYPRLGPTMEWDTGAGHCIAKCAGAIVEKFDRTPLDYNESDSLLNPFFVVYHPQLVWS